MKVRIKGGKKGKGKQKRGKRISSKNTKIKARAKLKDKGEDGGRMRGGQRKRAAE